MKLPDWSFLDEAQPCLDLAGTLTGLDRRVQEVVATAIADYVADLLSEVDQCETPIEALLFVALNARAPHAVHQMHGFFASISPQVGVDTEGGKYRPDFTVSLADGAQQHIVRAYIECDGHDFHEKTKAQAARDKRRDRDLTAKGDPIMHFTGSEIWRNPEACAREVMARLLSRWSERYGDR